MWNRNVMAMVAAAAVPLLLARAAVAGETPDLETVGRDFEKVSRTPRADWPLALTALEQRVLEIERQGVPSDRKAALQLLSGSIAFGLQQYDAARDAFRDAHKSDRDGLYADDAAFAAARALEASGRDDEAWKAWQSWGKKWPRSPLRGEMRLARSWNALRRHELALALNELDQMRVEFPWMSEDPRVVLARATASYLSERAAEALSLLDARVDPAAVYLRALCLREQDQTLTAAAAFQEVADRTQDARLRDQARLAKADLFLSTHARSAAEEFQLLAQEGSSAEVRREAALRAALGIFLDGDAASAIAQLRLLVAAPSRDDVAARGQLLLGEILYSQQRYAEAIPEFNRVLTDYFEHDLAATAHFRVGRSLDALGRGTEATGSYQAVVSGYPLEREAPVAAYLAGVGLLELGKPRAAVPYFQLVLDRYARTNPEGNTYVFETAAHRELVEASLCLLQLSYHRAGDLGQLSGVPHLMLQQMPTSSSSWRAQALLIDADALASQGRFAEAQAGLEALIAQFPQHAAVLQANQLLAWTYAQQGDDARALEIEESMLRRYGHQGGDVLATAQLHKAHVLFNRKSYREAAAAYESFVQKFPENSERLLALYQLGITYARLEQHGDAVDRWETLLAEAPGAEIAESAWLRAGDTYFRAEQYAEAQRCYEGLLQHFASSNSAARGLLRIAQCEYNAGRDAEALQRYSEVAQRYSGTEVGDEAKRGIEQALYRLGSRADGTQVLAELVERFPSSSFAADAQFQIASRLHENQSYAEAAQEFRRVVTQFPGHSTAPRAQFLLAESSEQSGDVEQAREAYEQFVRFFPDHDLHPTAQFRAAMLHFQAGAPMRAAVHFNKLVSEGSDPDLVSASLYNLALCQRLVGAQGEALVLLERYRNEHPKDNRTAEVSFQIGDVHEQSGQLDQAVTEYRKALKAKPGTDLEVQLYYRLGVCREGLGELQRALANYVKASGSSRKSDTYRLSAVGRMAALYEEQENYRKAIGAYKDLIRNAPDEELVAAAKERVSQLETLAQ